MHQRKSNKADKKREHTTRGEDNLRQVLKPQRACTPAQVDTMKAGTTCTTSPQTCTHFVPTFQKYIRFLPFVVSEFSGVRQNRPNKNSFLPCFCPFPPWLYESLPTIGARNAGGFKECRTLESMQQRTPPICGAESAFYPHNFPHQKYRKKSPWSDWKKFRKKLVGKCFGGRESPQSWGKGAMC